MKPKNLFFSLFLLTAVCAVTLGTTQSYASGLSKIDEQTNPTYQFDFSLFEIPEDIQEAIVTSVNHRSSEILTGGTYFVVGNYAQSGQWAVGLIAAALDNEPPDFGESIWFIVHRENEQWIADLQGSTEFLTLVDNVPDSLMPDGLKQSLAGTLDPNNIQANDFKFPWHYSQTWKYTSSWHSGNSVDFAPYNVPADQQNWLSAGDGYLVSTCGIQGDGYQAFLRVENSTLGNMTYGHLAANTIPVDLLNTNIFQGRSLGRAYNGTQGQGYYNIGAAWPWPSCTPPNPPNCNWTTRTGCCWLQYKTACGAGTGAHFHWTLPSKTTTVNGWSANTDGIWRKEGQPNRGVNSLFNDSTNGTDTTPPTLACSTPSSNQWYSTNQTIACTASDPESGVSYIRWAWNNSSPGTQVNGSSLTVNLNSAPQGQNTFYVQAWNGNSIASSVQSYGWFGYDTQPPSNPSSVNSGCGAGNNVWQNTCNDPNFTWSGASDGVGSGVKDYQYYWGANSTGSPNTYTTSAGFDPTAVPGSVATYYLRVAARDQLNQQNPNPSTLFVLRYDSASPTASLAINNGAGTTNQVSVSLDLTASDVGSGVDKMRVSNNGLDWSAWQTYQDTLSWTLPALDQQEHTVYVQVKDRAGNVSTTASDAIILDLYPLMPHSASFRICANVVNAGGQTGLQSGSYRLTTSIGETGITGSQSVGYRGQGGFLSDLVECLPIERAAGEEFDLTNSVIASGGSLRSSASFILGDTAGEAFTSAQNELSSVNYRLTTGFWADTDSDIAPPPPQPTPLPTTTPLPTATPGPTPTPVPGGFGISINDGALYTNSANVMVRVAAPNVTQVRLSNDGQYVDDNWVSYQTTFNWTLSTFGNYVLPRFVYVWFRDSEGIVYGAYMDDVIYDPVAPEGSVTLLGGGDNDAVILYLHATDDNSGVAEMRISTDENFAGADWQPYEQFLTWDEPGAGAYAQFRDRAGNLSPIYFTIESDSMFKVYLPTIIR